VSAYRRVDVSALERAQTTGTRFVMIWPIRSKNNVFIGFIGSHFPAERSHAHTPTRRYAHTLYWLLDSSS
jgi:hypothetical protein